MKTRKLDLFVVISCGVVIVGFVFFSSNPATLARAIRQLQFPWIAAALGFMIAHWLAESAALHLLLKESAPHRRFWDTVRVTMGGQYFNAITPFASGGQPFQAYYLTRQGMDVGDAAGGLLGRFLAYQTALVAVSTVLLIARLAFFLERVTNFTLVVLVGYLVNLAVLAALVTVGWFRGAADGICRRAIRLGGKLRLLKDPGKTQEKADESLRRFHAKFQFILRHRGRLWISFLFSVAQIVTLFAVPWCVYRAFGLSGTDLLTVIAAQGFVSMIASFVPLPGSSGGAEGAFYFFYRPLFSDDGSLAVAMILWRLITFYFTVVVGAVFALRAHKTVGQMPPGEKGEQQEP